MKTKYGAFSKDGSEYIITRPDTPRPWINYLTNGDYVSLCSHRGGGFSFYKDHRMHAIMRRGNFVHLDDMPGRMIYVKDEESGEIWMPNVSPIGKFDTFESRHGMGYTRLTTEYKKIKVSATWYVPQGIDAELCDLTVVNTGKKPRKIAIYTLNEMTLGSQFLDEQEIRIISLFNRVEKTDRSMIFTKEWWHTLNYWYEGGTHWPMRVFQTSTVKPSRMIANRDAFMGAYRTHANPIGLESKLLPACADSGKDVGSVWQWRISLAAGKSWENHMAIGIQKNEASAENTAMIDSLQEVDTYTEAWTRTRTWWDNLMGAVTIKTPDRDINTMINYWNKLQLAVNFYIGRGPSYYHKGQYPAMRDSCQDAFGMIPLSPTMARENIKRLAGFFYKDGRSCGGCNRIGLPEGPSHKVDLPLWLSLCVGDYVRETGDYTLLDEVIPYVDGGASSIYERMIAGIDRIIEDRGSHGLPLIGTGDWNDAANKIGKDGKGESVWLAQFLVFAINEIMPFIKRRNDTARLDTYTKRAAEIKVIVNRDCWDGEWFVRAFRDDGRPVGVKGQKEGFIWINSQTWAVISDISDKKRLNTCMDSVEKHLGTKYGLMNLGPAFTTTDNSIGLITSFFKGWKENAGVFSHASSFNVVARAMLGRGKDAVDLFKRILPTGKTPDLYLQEPYIYSQFCVGPSSKDEFGTGAYHWLSGTAAWMFRAAIDYIIGVHPELDGLRINPAVDPSWKKFSISRRFRDAMYEIEFVNPNGVESGVTEILLDGVAVKGNLLPLPTAERHVVKVTMG